MSKDDDLHKAVGAICAESGSVGPSSHYWKIVSQSVPNRIWHQCFQRWKSILEKHCNLAKGPWSTEEDVALEKMVKEHGAMQWSAVACHLPGRSSKQCRERWEKAGGVAWIAAGGKPHGITWLASIRKWVSSSILCISFAISLSVKYLSSLK